MVPEHNLSLQLELGEVGSGMMAHGVVMTWKRVGEKTVPRNLTVTSVAVINTDVTNMVVINDNVGVLKHEVLS